MTMRSLPVTFIRNNGKQPRTPRRATPRFGADLTPTSKAEPRLARLSLPRPLNAAPHRVPGELFIMPAALLGSTHSLAQLASEAGAASDALPRYTSSVPVVTGHSTREPAVLRGGAGGEVEVANHTRCIAGLIIVLPLGLLEEHSFLKSTIPQTTFLRTEPRLHRT